MKTEHVHATNTRIVPVFAKQQMQQQCKVSITCHVMSCHLMHMLHCMISCVYSQDVCYVFVLLMRCSGLMSYACDVMISVHTCVFRLIILSLVLVLNLMIIMILTLCSVEI